MSTPRIGQTHSKIGWQQPTSCLSVVDHFVELAPKKVNVQVIDSFEWFRIESVTEILCQYCPSPPPLRFQSWSYSYTYINDVPDYIICTEAIHTKGTILHSEFI